MVDIPFNSWDKRDIGPLCGRQSPVGPSGTELRQLLVPRSSVTESGISFCEMVVVPVRLAANPESEIGVRCQAALRPLGLASEGAIGAHEVGSHIRLTRTGASDALGNSSGVPIACSPPSHIE